MSITIWNGEYTAEPLKGKPVLDVLLHAYRALCEAPIGNKATEYCWVAAGTCLQLYRDCEVDVADDDVDLECTYNIQECEEQFKTFFESRGYRLIRTAKDSNTGYVYQHAYIHIQTNIIVDIMFLRNSDGLLITEAETSGVYTYPSEWLDKLTYHTIGYMCEEIITLPMLNPSEYVQWVYGDTWNQKIAKKDCKWYYGKADSNG